MKTRSKFKKIENLSKRCRALIDHAEAMQHIANGNFVSTNDNGVIAITPLFSKAAAQAAIEAGSYAKTCASRVFKLHPELRDNE